MCITDVKLRLLSGSMPIEGQYRERTRAALVVVMVKPIAAAC